MSAVRPRVLIVEPAGLLWGSERALLDLLDAFDRERFEIVVACPPESPILPHLKQLGIQSICLPLALLHTRGRLARIRAMFGLAAAMWQLRPDLVHLNQAGIIRLASLPAKWMGIPIISHVRLAEDAVLIRNRLSSRLAPRAAIAISDWIGERLQGGSTSVRRVYDPYKFVRPLRARSDVRQSFGIPSDAPLVSMAARLCDGKRHDLLIRAIALLPDSRSQLLLIGGETGGKRGGPSYESQLRAIAAELGLARRVTFAGIRDDVLDLLAASDVVALPSESEAFGRVLLESLSVGVPIVGSDTGGPREIIGNFERGYLFSSGDVQSLADALAQALGSKLESERRTRAGTAWVQTQCSPAGHARQIEAIYTEVLHASVETDAC